MGRLFLLFVGVSLVELYLLLRVGAVIGPLGTLALILVTGAVGAALARREGLRVLHRLRQDMEAGRLPTDAAMDGVCVLVAGALLITPGVLTDLLGFGLLTAPFRAVLKAAIRRRLGSAVRSGHVSVHTVDFGPPPGARRPEAFDALGRGPVIDVTPIRRGGEPEEG